MEIWILYRLPHNDDTIAWYENNGAADPSWTAADIATSADAAQSVFAADMDGDGDMDIVSASYLDDTIAWYENNGAADPSWTKADIATSADGAYLYLQQIWTGMEIWILYRLLLMMIPLLGMRTLVLATTTLGM